MSGDGFCTSTQWSSLESASLKTSSMANKAILSEDSLRQLSKSLTGLIPNNVDVLEEGVIEYGIRHQAEEDY